MSRYVKTVGLVAVVAAVVFVTAGLAFAQEETADAPFRGYGPWGMGRTHGPGPGMAGGFMAEYRDVIHEKVADALDITVEELEAALAEGKSPYTLAQEGGIDLTELQAVMTGARAEVLAQAVADGKITQEQADWTLEHHRGRGAGLGNCDQTGNMWGNGPGRGRMGGFGPRFTPANP